MSTPALTGSAHPITFAPREEAIEGPAQQHTPRAVVNPPFAQRGANIPDDERNLRNRVIELELENQRLRERMALELEEPLARLADLQNTQREREIIEESKTSIPAILGTAVSVLPGIVAQIAGFGVRRLGEVIQNRAVEARAWKRFGPDELDVIRYKRGHLGMTKEQALIELLKEEMQHKRIPVIVPCPASIESYLEEHEEVSRDMAIREIARVYVHDWGASASLPSEQNVSDYKQANPQLSREAAFLELTRLKLERHQIPFAAPTEEALNRYIAQNQDASRESAFRVLIEANISEWKKSNLEEQIDEGPSFGDLGMPDSSFDFGSFPDMSGPDLGW